MNERLYLDRPDVYIVADYSDALLGGRALHVVCEHPDGAAYAAQLAAALNVPLYQGSGAPGEDPLWRHPAGAAGRESA